MLRDDDVRAWRSADRFTLGRHVAQGGRILATVADGTRGNGGRRCPVGGAILGLAPKASSGPRTKPHNRSVSTLGQGDTPSFGSPGTGNNYPVQLVHGGRHCRVLRVRRPARMHAAIAPAAAKVSLRREGEGGCNREVGWHCPFILIGDDQTFVLLALETAMKKRGCYTLNVSWGPADKRNRV
jgi:hypothetical protein